MKKIINAILFIYIILITIYVIDINKYNPKDVNRDGVVDAIDLLLVRKEILKEED